jgi:glycosyltransferase involved in cell wall biosynthesis
VVFVTHTDSHFKKLSKICHNCGAKVSFTACEYPEYLIEDTKNRRSNFIEYSKYIDKYIFETKTLEDYYIDVIQRKIDSLVVPATMPFEDILACNKTETKPYIAYCGSISSEKKDGLSNIIRAFSEFHVSHKSIGLKFIGRISKPDYLQQLQNLVKELNIQEYVEFTGEVNRAEYVKYLTNAQLMIVAKPIDSYYGGGLSSKVIEYLFSGNPIVMVGADDFVHYLTHRENVYFTSDNNPDTLFDALCEMFNDEELRSSIGIRGKEYALNNFNYHILTKGLLSFILK